LTTQGNYHPERVRRDVQKIVVGGNGIEHSNSASLDKGRYAFLRDDDYRNFAGLVAHEFFHLWNGKRTRPDGLGPFDYTKENYTRSLCVVEGFADYYSSLFWYEGIPRCTGLPRSRHAGVAGSSRPSGTRRCHNRPNA